MKPFLGTKKVLAKPMTFDEYNKYRGFKNLEIEEFDNDGYLVEYLDGGKSNHPNHAGYISWSPKDVFENAYRENETPLERMLIEIEDLSIKIDALSKALESSNFLEKVGQLQFSLLTFQRDIMITYHNILKTRINHMQKGM